MLPRHPVIDIPDIGLRDHAWDVLGDWRATLALPDQLLPVAAALSFSSWEAGELLVLGNDALPADSVPLRFARRGRVAAVDAGGGALAFSVELERFGLVHATLWPGEIQLNGEPRADGQVLFTATARRTLAYYRAKYPTAPG